MRSNIGVFSAEHLDVITSPVTEIKDFERVPESIDICKLILKPSHL